MKGKVLIQPIISEKSFKAASDNNVYTFKVAKSANKIDVSFAVVTEFDVKVEEVKIVNVRPRHVRFGKSRKVGQRSAWKKAMVKLAEGDKIEIFEVN